MSDADRSFAVRAIILTLCTIVVVMTMFLLHGLVDPRVDNKDIFAIIGPAFQIVVGGFVGYLGGLITPRRQENPEPKPVPEAAALSISVEKSEATSEATQATEATEATVPR